MGRANIGQSTHCVEENNEVVGEGFKMANGDRNLDYEHHLANYTGLDLITGDPAKDAQWHCEAEYVHALSVCDGVRDALTTIATLAQSVTNVEAQMQLKFGAVRRTMFIWLSLRQLLELTPPNRTDPLPHDDVDEAARDLNVIYINIRGTLDNFAWCLVSLFGEERTRQLPPMKIDLFGNDFLKDANLREVAEFMNGFAEWNKNLKTRRDPAAHRIPLTVPPAVLDEAEQIEYARLSAEHAEASNAAARAVGEGADSSVLFEKATLLYDRIQRLGTFAPLFLHNPDEGVMNIYPLVPQDIGQLVKIVRGLANIISSKLAA